MIVFWELFSFLAYIDEGDRNFRLLHLSSVLIIIKSHQGGGGGGGQFLLVVDLNRTLASCLGTSKSYS